MTSSLLVPPSAAKEFKGRPLLAATLIVVDLSGSQPRILMGRRRPDAVFLPGKYVFPGGRVERSDGDVATAGALSAHDLGCLKRGVRHADPERGLRAFVSAAIRETFEETGYLVSVDGPVEADALQSGWNALLESGVRPDLNRLRYIARAITPPGRPRRYDTRFFLAEASAVHCVVSRTDGELSEIGWFGLDQVSDHDLPSITRMVLADLKVALDGTSAPEIPFYFWRSGAFRRAVLKGRGSSLSGAA
ncbi:MAG: NUDIX hydrolase [Hyphomicrobium sp.]|nr:NUDIX hydrolase [Hyphomicrobium sp.]